MKILRRLFNKDELIGESILNKIEPSISVEETENCFKFEIDNFNVSIHRIFGFDMSGGGSWCNYQLSVDNISLSISKSTLSKIFTKIDHICHQEEYHKKEILEEENRMIYKDIKMNFSNDRK